MAIERARSYVADLVNVDASEIVFTSGATEANAIAILGIARAARSMGDRRRRIVISAIEHKSVLECANRLSKEGFEIIKAPVDDRGVINLEALSSLVDDTTLLVSIMAANNEVGVIQPLSAIAEITRSADAMLHVDASQQAGKMPIDLTMCDFASLSAHKMYGPGGVGALFISSAAAVRPEPLFGGGGQENGIRPGTLPVPLIVGFGAAAYMASERLSEDADHARRLAAMLESLLRERQLNFTINGLGADRLPGSLSLQFNGCEAASLIARLSPLVSIAEGSACTSGQITPSHVLTAMGRTAKSASETVRIFCGRYNTDEEIRLAADAIATAVQNETIANWTNPPVGSGHERRASRF